LAEPKRSGPAQALAASVSGGSAALAFDALGSMWRFRPGVTGARAYVEATHRSEGFGTVALGFEEQHGVRRESRAALAARASGLAQGWWWEWRGGSPALGLALRHEAWGARSMARRPVRVVTTARLEAQAPAGLLLRLTHAVFRVRPGESLYLPEVLSDRLVLRALSGAGERTRLELALPAGRGSLRAALNLSSKGIRRLRSQWTLDWTRRARLKRGR
jgi:hypothetical protein